MQFCQKVISCVLAVFVFCSTVIQVAAVEEQKIKELSGVSSHARILGVGETIDLGEIEKLKYSQSGTRYISSDGTVASVSFSGIVTAKSPGETEILYQMSNGIQSIYPIEVKPMAQNVNLDQEKLLLGVGESYQVEVLLPDGTAAFYQTLVSDHPETASVSADGEIQAVQPGTASVQCTLSNGASDSCLVEVMPMAQEVFLSSETINLFVGESFVLESSVPDGTAAYYRQYTSNHPEVAEISDGVITAHAPGTAVVTCTLSNGKSAQCTVTVTDKMTRIKDVPVLGQNRLPTGCETCSAAMVLQYYGYPVSETEFADKYLKRGNLFYQNGRLYGPDPNSKFIGSPYTSSSYGILANGMAASINQYLKDTAHQAKSLHGESVEKLCQEYIGKGDPVMLWATINMMKSGKSTSWIISDTDENSIYNKGDVFTWTTQEHCLVLTGYDESSYYFNDPWIGKAVSYPRETVEARYQEMESQAVVIIKK